MDKVDTTLRMEEMKLTKANISMLRAYKNGEVTGEELRKQILSEVYKGGSGILLSKFRCTKEQT